MFRMLVASLFALFVTASVYAQDAAKAVSVPQHLQDVSVTIRAEGNRSAAEGSGVVFTRNGTNFVWTAAHVIRHMRTTRSVTDPSGGNKTVVEFGDVQVIKMLYDDNRIVGKIIMDARVVRFSSDLNGHDLALLEVRKKNFLDTTIKFYSGDNPPPIGADLYHVGSLLGQFGSNSLTSGIVSQIGRMYENYVYDQTTCTAFPGSSGGGVYTRADGLYIGMLTRGAGEQFNLIVPVRRMRAWAKSAKIEWAMDEKIPMPSADDLLKLPVEDSGNAGSPRAQNDGHEDHNKSNFWIRIIQREQPIKFVGPLIDR